MLCGVLVAVAVTVLVSLSSPTPYPAHGVIFSQKTVLTRMCFFYFHRFVVIIVVTILVFFIFGLFLFWLLFSTAGIVNLCSNYSVIVVIVKCCQKQDITCHQLKIGSIPPFFCTREKKFMTWPEFKLCKLTLIWGLHVLNW